MGVNEMYNLEAVRSASQGEQISRPGFGTDHTAFGKALQEKVQENLNFSKHAAKRMDQRGIAIDSRLMNDLEQAVEGARKKGAKDVAVIGRQGVFIVNVPNNVVVTTMSGDDMKDKIFTNIDSAVLM